MNENMIDADAVGYIVDEMGGTFAFATREAADAFYDSEMRGGSEELERFAVRVPESMSLEDLAEYACVNGWDGTPWGDF